MYYFYIVGKNLPVFDTLYSARAYVRNILKSDKNVNMLLSDNLGNHFIIRRSISSSCTRYFSV